MADPIVQIVDIIQLRSLAAAVTPQAGSDGIENVNGTLKKVTDLGVVTDLGGAGGGSGYVTGAALTGAGQTLTPGTGSISEQDMAAGLTAGAINLHLAVAGAFTWQIYMVKIAAQAFAVSFINDGPAAGTTTLAPSALINGMYFQFNGSDWVFLSRAFLSS